MQRVICEPRPGWIEKAESLGFGFHTMYGEPYWDETRYWAFSLAEIEDRIEDPSTQLHAMCLDAVDRITQSEELMTRLAIPAAFHEAVATSWARRDPHLYGRFDLAYTGQGPAKLLEYNADTPTSLYESSAFQWLWLEDMIGLGRLSPDTDQFNLIHESIVERFRQIFPSGGVMHFSSVTDNEEDRQTVLYLQEMAQESGLAHFYVPIEEIGIDREGRFLDDRAYVMEALFKLYPWEHMLREDFGQYVPATRTRLIEPLWKSLLSNKGILPVLWDMYPGHENLLPAYFSDDPRAADLSSGRVVKPIFSREGANIRIEGAAAPAESSDGEYGAEGSIVQAYTPLAMAGEDHAVLGVWIVGDTARGLGIREDKSAITRNLSRFVPHVILPG